MNTSTRSVRLAIVAISLVLLALALGSCTESRPPAPVLFDGKWDDLSVYEAGLIRSEQGALELLQDATVYHIDLAISPDFMTLAGREQARYTNRETVDLSAVYFNLYPNFSGGKTTVSAVEVDGKPAAFAIEAEDSALRVTLPQALKPQAAATLQVDFTVDIPQSPSGNYGLFGYFNDELALDDIYPAIAVYDDSGWHVGRSPPIGDKTYLDASFYLVRVKAPADLVLVASGSQVHREKEGSDQLATFAAGPARDFYIAASSRFVKVSGKAGLTTINSYQFPDQVAGARRALAVAEDAVKVFGSRLGDYPYTELDIVPVPLGSGALGIEYPGVFGIGPDAYARDDLLESTVAHETGHQWFYNVVGDDQVNQPWLDESLTQYITGLYYLDTYGNIGWLYSRQGWISGWNRIGQAAIPLGLPIASYKDAEYVAIIYARGPLFFDALAKKIGEQQFKACLKQYYLTNKWQIVTTASIQAQFEACSTVDLDELFKTWVLPGSQAG